MDVEVLEERGGTASWWPPFSAPWSEEEVGGEEERISALPLLVVFPFTLKDEEVGIEIGALVVLAAVVACDVVVAVAVVEVVVAVVEDDDVGAVLRCGAVREDEAGSNWRAPTELVQ